MYFGQRSHPWQQVPASDLGNVAAGYQQLWGNDVP